MKVLINNREDFDNWWECNDSYKHISYDEDVPKYYPCIVSFRIVGSNHSIYDNLYYEFVYLQDFSELHEERPDDEPETISEIVPHPLKFNVKTQPCVLTNQGIVTEVIKFN